MSHCSVAGAGAYGAPEGIYAQGGCPHVTVVMAAVGTQRGTAPGTFHSQEEFWCLWFQVALGTLQGTEGLGGTWGAHGLLSWVPRGLSTTGTCCGWVPLTAWQKVNWVA